MLDDGNQYVYGAGLTAMKQSGSWHYYLADGLGSTMAIVDSSGNSQRSYTYDVYGEVTGGAGSLSNQFDFAGQQTDPTGLQYLRARYYDPATGTFLSRDLMARSPLWIEGAHTYVGANPVGRIDPTGLCQWGLPNWLCDLPVLGDESVGKVANDVSSAGSKVTSALASIADSLASLPGRMPGLAAEALDMLALIGEYLAKVAEGCAVRPVDCYFALEHISIGIAMVELSIAATAATCAASAGLACVFAGAAFAPVLVTGLAVVAVGLDELRHLAAIRESPGPGGGH